MKFIKRFANWFIALTGVIVLSIPLITRNKFYSDVVTGQDFIAHRKVIDATMQNVSYGRALYFGDKLFGEGLGQLNKVLHIDSNFLLFSFMLLSLIGVAWAMYFLGRTLNNKTTGWILVSMILSMPVAVIQLFYTGIIYNLINIYIVLPCAIVMLVKWYQYHKWYYLLSGIFLLLLFSVLHLSGMYLLYAILLFLATLVILMASNIIKAKQALRYGGIALLVLMASVVAMRFVFLPESLAMNNETIQGIIPSIQQGIPLLTIMGDLVGWYVSIPVVLIGTITGCLFIANRKRIKLRGETKAGLLILMCFTTVLLGGIILNVADFPKRLMADAGGLLVILVGLCFGSVMQRFRYHWALNSCFALIIISGVSTLILWVT